MRFIRTVRWPLVLIMLFVLAVPTAVLASSSPHAKPLHHDMTTGARTHSSTSSSTSVSAAAQPANAAGTNQFTTTANPVTLDPPVSVPPTAPTTVTILRQQSFPGANGQLVFSKTLAMPSGRWSEVVLHVDGQQSGRQYDRLLQIYDGSNPLFVGVTPEPTATGISWHLTRDVSPYLPILQGSQTFTVTLANYLSSIDNGIPNVSVSLDFYKGGAAITGVGTTASSAPAIAADSIFPISSAGANSLDTVRANSPLQARVNLPNDLTSAQLQFYAVPQIGEEFWWGMEPTFREIEVSVDGKPAGVVWPFPYIYTGGVNPLLWRPVTSIQTMDLPTYTVDLSPFAGLLNGQHTITLSVTNNSDYWLIGGSILVQENHGHPTSGKLLTDTLSFPTTADVQTTNALGSSANQVYGETATRQYEIKGQVTSGGKTWTDDITGSLQFGDDQTNIMPNYLQYVHNEQTVTTTEVAQGPGSRPTTQRVTDVYTVDAPEAFLQSGGNFYLPSQVAESRDQTVSNQVGTGPAQLSHLYESEQGYGALEEDSSAPTITDGSTTGTVLYQNERGQQYQRLIVARGGVILHDTVTDTISGRP